MPVEVIMPKVDMDMTEGTLAVWHVPEGAAVEKGQPLFDIETAKASMEVESPASGILRAVSAEVGTTVPIGTVLALVQTEGEAEPVAASIADAVAVPVGDEVQSTPLQAHPERSANRAGLRASPLARRLARQFGLALDRIEGSGPRGRITRADVEASAARPAASTPDAFANSDARVVANRLGLGYRLEPTSRMRQVMARRLTESKATIPHFYLEADLRLDPLLAFRDRINAGLAALGGQVRVSLTDCLVRASALALMAVPEANAAWAEDGILRYDAAHVSVAVSVQGGLMTPVLRHADRKALAELARELSDLAERARSGRLAGEAIVGGSFSISNLGMFGVRRFKAIINPPESMILAVGKAERRWLVGEDDAPVVATMMSVTLSCDHRVVDGALGARWLAHFVDLVEHPSALL